MNMKTVKASTAKSNSKPPPGDKSLGIETAIRFYKIEYGDKNEEGEESENLVIHDLILTTTNKNLIKRDLPYIDTLDQQRPAVVRVIWDITARVFGNIEPLVQLKIDSC